MYVRTRMLWASLPTDHATLLRISILRRNVLIIVLADFWTSLASNAIFSRNQCELAFRRVARDTCIRFGYWMLRVSTKIYRVVYFYWIPVSVIICCLKTFSHDARFNLFGYDVAGALSKLCGRGRSVKVMPPVVYLEQCYSEHWYLCVDFSTSIEFGYWIESSALLLIITGWRIFTGYQYWVWPHP